MYANIGTFCGFTDVQPAHRAKRRGYLVISKNVLTICAANRPKTAIFAITRGSIGDLSRSFVGRKRRMDLWEKFVSGQGFGSVCVAGNAR